MQKIIKELSEELHLDKNVILEIYKSYWRFIKQTIEGIDFNNIKSIKDYNRHRLNFNIPNIGKLYCSFDRINNIRKQSNYINEFKHKKDKTDV